MSRFNPRLVKIHRSYTVSEIAGLCSVHKNTVREWIKQGLSLVDEKRPILIQGKVLREFLEHKRKKNKKSCRPGEIYCVKCREPRQPADQIADYKPLSDTQGNLIGICPVCEILIYRRVSLMKLDVIKGNLEVFLPQGLEHLKGRSTPSLNSDFKT